MLPSHLRKTALALVLDTLKGRSARISDDYPIRLTDLYMEATTEKRRLPTLSEWLPKASAIRTRFYRENPRIRKSALLAEIAGELERALGRTKEIRSLVASRNRIFISHSNIYPEIFGHFADLLGQAGYEPIVAEQSPNQGKSWHPGEKVEALIGSCSVLVAILTPDDSRTKEPRLNVVHEIGIAQGNRIPIIFLKAKETKLTSLLNPVYVPFRMDRPEDADAELFSNLRFLGL